MKVILLMICCGTATLSFAQDKADKPQSMSEPQPIKAYVHVVAQGQGEVGADKFMLCQHNDKECEKLKRTKKHLAVTPNRGLYPSHRTMATVK